MKRSWTALAVAFISIFAIVGCNDYGNTFQNNTGARINFLSPSNISAGSPDFTLTINGNGFVAKTFIEWNGKQLTTIDTTDAAGNVLAVSAVIPAALVAKPGTATVLTQNPFSGAGNNGLSNPVTFIINPPPNPLPTLTSISPTSIAPCGSSCAGASFTLDLVGTNFLASSDPTQVSQVRWTSGATVTTLVTTSVTSTDIKATVPGSLYSAAGTASVTVFNPPAPQTTPVGGTPNPQGGGGGSSAPQTFTIGASGAATPKAAAKSVVESAAEFVVEETPVVSADGRYVAYTAYAPAGVAPADHTQIFVHDTCEGASAACTAKTSLVSAASDGSPANGDSTSPSMSANGRYIAFNSASSNLTEHDSSGRQIYLRDTCAGADSSCVPATQIVSTDSNGALTAAESILPSVSATGRFVAFLAIIPSHAAKAAGSPANSTSGTTNSGFRQVFVRDTCIGASACTPKTSKISLVPGDGNGVAKLAGPSVSGNGKTVALSGQLATLFTRSVAIDDGVFLASANPDK
jgi:WD40 repeat protein